MAKSAIERATTEGTPLTKKQSKYKVKRTEYNGRMYDSPAEAERAKKLDAQKAAGTIKWWIPQVTIELGIPENKYRVDFLVGECVYGHKDEVLVVAEDVKGFETPKFKKTRKLWAKYGPFPLHILHVLKNGFLTEIIG